MISNWLRSGNGLPELNSVAECDSVLENDLVILFKHSPTCPISWMAHREVMQFFADHPGVSTFLVSVRRRRDVARHIADRTGVIHESPQVLVLRNGALAGAASHGEITAGWLRSTATGAPGTGVIDQPVSSDPLSLG